MPTRSQLFIIGRFTDGGGTGSGGRGADRIRGSGSEKDRSNGKSSTAGANSAQNGHHRTVVMNNYHGGSPSHRLGGHASSSSGGAGLGLLDANGKPSSIIGRIVVALYNYMGSECGDMTFQKGDQMEIVDDSDPDWWVAVHLASGSKGHIPRNYVAFQSSIESEE